METGDRIINISVKVFVMVHFNACIVMFA